MRENNPVKVSVIIPVYNTQKYLDRCMESLTNQTMKDIELIIVDDGSKAECARLCDEWGEKDSRIKVIHKKNQGLGFARNTGIECASGKYLAFVDSDDYVSLNMYQKLYERAKMQSADIVVGGYIKKYGNGDEKEFRYEGIPSVLADEQIISVLLANMLGAPPEYFSDDYIGMSVWKNLYAREIFEKYSVRFPSEREYISEDIIFHINYLKYAKCAAVITEPYYYYCQNGQSLTTTYREDRFEQILKLYLYENELLNNMDALDSGKLQLQRTFIANARVCIMQESANGRRTKQVQAAKKRIERICENKTLQQVLREFPYERLPWKQRIFSGFIQKKKKNVLYILADFQNRRNIKKGN